MTFTADLGNVCAVYTRMSWRHWVKPVFIVFYTVLLCTTLPLLVIEFRTVTPAVVSAWFIGGMFVLGAVPISLWTILDHLVHFTKPYLQLPIIRILWMVPIYALDAWFALKFPHLSIYFDTLRECYEAYVIYNFLTFLLNYLRHEYPDFLYLVEQKPQVKHIFPFCCLRNWPMGRSFIDHCRHGTLQYTVVRPVTTVVALICELFDVYGEADFSFHKAFLYLTIINNVSQVWALYCLVLFYQCTKEELRPMSPISKFLCVKFVVFMSFWQSILFFILAVAGVFKDVKIWEMKEVNSIGIVLQNFAICIEMFIAALAHHFSFSYQPYVDPDAPEMNCCASCWYMWNVSDMRRDVCEHIRHIGHSVTSIGFPRRSTDRRPDRSAARFLSDSSDHSQDNDTETNPLLKSSHPERSGSPGVDHSFSEPVFVPVSNRLVLLAANANNGQVVADNDPAPSVTQQTTNRDMLATNGVC